MKYKSAHITTQAQLEELISRYFEGETSVQEEQALRQCLADCPWQSETIDEARFTMGYFAAHRRQLERKSRWLMNDRIIGIAASIAVILAVGGYVIWHQQPQTTDMCIAYVNGKTIDSSEQVMELIENDLNTIGEASQGMTAQLSSLGEALEIDNE
ncbi:MAG: hypothetical protein IKW97_01640 [Muribaculaceae bacterium]|nr:hypothetical protein [Muribaculaceae bacterium]